jgi:hypothetical protein
MTAFTTPRVADPSRPRGPTCGPGSPRHSPASAGRPPVRGGATRPRTPFADLIHGCARLELEWAARDHVLLPRGPNSLHLELMREYGLVDIGVAGLPCADDLRIAERSPLRRLGVAGGQGGGQLSGVRAAEPGVRLSFKSRGLELQIPGLLEHELLLRKRDRRLERLDIRFALHDSLLASEGSAFSLHHLLLVLLDVCDAETT